MALIASAAFLMVSQPELRRLALPSMRSTTSRFAVHFSFLSFSSSVRQGFLLHIFMRKRFFPNLPGHLPCPVAAFFTLLTFCEVPPSQAFEHCVQSLQRVS